MRQGGLGGGAQRERQPAAPFGEGGGAVAVGGDPVPDEGAQQAQRVAGRQRAEPDAVRPVPGDQVREAAPAGGEHRAARGAGEQRPYLVRRRDVVQHHQNAAPGKQGAVAGGPLVRRLGHVVAGYAEGAQEGGEYVGGGRACAG